MESFQTFVTESLDKPYDWTIPKSKDHPNSEFDKNFNEEEVAHYEYPFKSESGKEFVVAFWQEAPGDHNWKCLFYTILRDDEGKYKKTTSNITGESKHESMRIFATVIDIIREWVEWESDTGGSFLHRYIEDDISYLRFDVKADEPSRVKLYERMFKKINIKGFWKSFRKYVLNGHMQIELTRKSRFPNLSDEDFDKLEKKLRDKEEKTIQKEKKQKQKMFAELEKKEKEKEKESEDNKNKDKNKKENKK